MSIFFWGGVGVIPANKYVSLGRKNEIFLKHKLETKGRDLVVGVAIFYGLERPEFEYR